MNTGPENIALTTLVVLLIGTIVIVLKAYGIML